LMMRPFPKSLVVAPRGLHSPYPSASLKIHGPPPSGLIFDFSEIFLGRIRFPPCFSQRNMGPRVLYPLFPSPGEPRRISFSLLIVFLLSAKAPITFQRLYLLLNRPRGMVRLPTRRLPVCNIPPPRPLPSSLSSRVACPPREPPPPPKPFFFSLFPFFFFYKQHPGDAPRGTFPLSVLFLLSIVPLCLGRRTPSLDWQLQPTFK